MVDVLNQTERDELTPLVAGPSSLVTDPRTKQVWTLTRETDARTALTRGLAEYLSGLSIEWESGRECRLVKVLEVWSESEDPVMYPAAVIYAVDPGEYDASKLTPETVELPDTENQCIRLSAEFSQTIVVEVWANDPQERMALVAMLEDAFDPVDWMTGFRLDLPHYHGARATFEKLTLSYEDDADEARRGWRRAIFTLQGVVPQVRAVGKLPRMVPRFTAEVEDPGPET